jgi:hypothetical protein
VLQRSNREHFFPTERGCGAPSAGENHRRVSEIRSHALPFNLGRSLSAGRATTHFVDPTRTGFAGCDFATRR